MENTLTTKSVAILVTAAVISGFAGGVVGNVLFPSPSLSSSVLTSTTQPVEMKLVDEKSEIINAIEKVSPSVVSIVISQDLNKINGQGIVPFDFFQQDPFFNNFFGQPFQGQPQQPQNNGQEDDTPQKQKVGGGSGFIISPEGLVLTNRHVVASDDADYTVILQDGTELVAEVVSRDVFNDIAVIKILPKDGEDLPQLTPVAFGNSVDLKIGQSVIAIGNALAEFQNSATRGIVSAIGRQIVASDGMGSGENLSGLIQTDAAINPGNSGGPLINLAGEVVGINTAIASGANGIGFAIPIDDVKPVVTSVKENGRIIRPILGVMFTMLTPELAKQLDLSVEEGALLKGDGKNFAVLPGKPAEQAGLQEKDVIISIDGNEINSKNPLQTEIMKHAPGDTLKVTYIRKGEEKTVEIRLDEADQDSASKKNGTK